MHTHSTHKYEDRYQSCPCSIPSPQHHCPPLLADIPSLLLGTTFSGEMKPPTKSIILMFIIVIVIVVVHIITVIVFVLNRNWGVRGCGCHGVALG